MRARTRAVCRSGERMLAMNASLAEKIKSADRGMLDRWTDPGTVDRGTGCLAHVREAVDCGDFIGGRVAGTSEYKTNV